MSRGIKNMTEAKLAQLRREGRGRGIGATYKPWVYITDLYSEGRTHGAYSYKTGRDHHLLSDGEQGLFAHLERARDVKDIREGFPLETDITLAVAEMLGIKHQYFIGTHIPWVMTLDFLVTRERGSEDILEGYSVKTAAGLEDEDTINELEILRETCVGMGIEHHLVVKERLPQPLTKNLVWIHKAQLDKLRTEPWPGFYEDQKLLLLQDLRARQYDGRVVDYCTDFDTRYSLEKGVAIRVIRMLLQQRALKMDLNNPDPQLAHMETLHLTKEEA